MSGTRNPLPALQEQVKVLREQIMRMDDTSAREREQTAERIEDLRGQLTETRADYRQAIAVLTDQRELPAISKKWFWQQ